MIVVCGVCSLHYDSIMRRCPDCGQDNEACTSKFAVYKFELEEATMVPFADLVRKLQRDGAECAQEAIEQWMDRQNETRRK